MFKPIVRLLLAACLPVLAGVDAAAASPAPPAAFAGLVPTALPNGLRLVEIQERCAGCEPWRTIDLHAGEAREPVRQEVVSVSAGVRAMYAFPGTGYFANAKIERSVAGSYPQDKATVLAALAHECAWMKERVGALLDKDHALRDRLDLSLLKERGHVEFERGSYRGYEYALCADNAIGKGGVAGMLHLFVPRSETIVTAYLLQAQDKPAFRTGSEFLTLRRAFIEQYIDFLPPAD